MEEKHTKTKRKTTNILRVAVKLLVAMVVVVAFLPATLYIPVVQDFVKSVASEKISEATGYGVEVGRFMLKFPMRLSINDFLVLDQKRDTMAAGRNITLDVRLLPLFMGDVVVRGIEVDNVEYNMISADSSMTLSAKIDKFELGRSTIELLTDEIHLSEASLDGADVELLMDSSKAEPAEPDSVSEMNWLIALRKLSLKNVNYRMSMMPAVDSLATNISEGEIDNIAVNLAVGSVRVGYLGVDSLSAVYIIPDDEDAEKFNEAMPVDSISDGETPSKDWTIIADSVRLNNSRALYAKKNVVPAEGLDFNYIEAGNINIGIDDFYSRGSKIRVPIRKITADERSGLCVRNVSGTFEMDDDYIKADSFIVQTLLSEIKINTEIGVGAFEGNDSSKISLSFGSDISLEEVGKIYPSLRPMLHSISRVDNAKTDLRVDGSGKKLDLKELRVDIPGIVSLSANGCADNLFDERQRAATLNLDGTLSGGGKLKHLAGLDSAFSVPVVRLSGGVKYAGSRLGAKLSAAVDSGKVVLDGDWNMTGERYSGKLAVKGFDMRSFMPFGSIGKIDCRMEAAGKGYDVYDMYAKAETLLDRVDYNGISYHNISLRALLSEGEYSIDIGSQNEFADAGLSLEGHIAHDRYLAKIKGSVQSVDLAAMNFSEKQLSGKLNINGVIRADVERGDYRGFMRLSDLDVIYGIDNFTTDSINIGFSSDSVNTRMRLRNKDLLLKFESPYGVNAWTDSFGKLASAMDTMLISQSVRIGELKSSLPDFAIDMGAGKDNIFYQYLSSSGIDYDKLFMDVDKKEDLKMRSYVSGLVAGGVQVDTVLFGGGTRADSLLYKLHVWNSPKNSALFKVADLEGRIYDNKFSANLLQFDKDDVKGFDFGIDVTMRDSVAKLHLLPEQPVIAFREWTLNKDNFISYDLSDDGLQADLKIKSGDNSHINIYTDAPVAKNNGINIELAGIEIADWLTLSPFSPPVDGTLSSNLKIYYSDKYVWGNGDVTVDELFYGKKRIGDVDLKSKLAYVGNTRNIYATMDMDVDGKQVATVRGYRNDTVPASVYDLRIGMRQFPLSLLNAFMPEGVGAASGYMNAGINFKGTMEEPDIRGFVGFDSARVVSSTYGARFDFDTVKIPVENGLIKFNDYKLYGANGSPIVIDGDFQFLPFDKMQAGLTISGKNVQVVDSKKSGMAEIYGKGFADVHADVSGYLNELDVKASLSLLSGTDLTYVMQSATSEISQSSDDGVVEFVSFNDTAKVAQADTVVQRPFSMRINALLTIQPNAVFTVFLSTDGKNRVNLDGEGSLSYSQTYQGDINVTGKYVINGGFVRYTPPMLSEKLFNFVEGSNVVWTGDLLNPSLNVKAVETVKANVTTGQNTRLVPFDVSLNVGNSLNQLDVSFDLSTEGDMTIANELSGMTQEQRSAQAMNLLLYGTYSGGSTGTTGGLSGENMAFSFLESSLNKWAANNISGVDLSFGIDQYDKTVDGTTSTTTSYSYKMSKSIFDDRFKIVVGGNYSTDASAEDNLAQNLFNDISFEYKLNKAGTAYVKLFRHTEYESILEGEITETGGGFVWRRKIASWRDMFRFFRSGNKPTDVDNKLVTDSVGNKNQQ